MNPAPSSRSFPGLDRCRRGRWRPWATALLAAGTLIAAGAGAAEPAVETATQVRATLARLEAHKEALARANAAVVGVEVVAVEDARSIATLGKLRQGSGILIGDDGLVLTIGYLILEADQVELVSGDGRHVPARVVAYDLASGFGLVQSLAPLGIAPAPLGVSAAVATDEPLLFASGGDEHDLSLARMVSRRPFSGYWEYHIEDALFTAPARTDHSGAGLFNADGELVGVGSLLVGNAAGSNGPAMRGNMFVPVDLLKPILAELRSSGSSRSSSRAWLGLNCVEVGGQVHVVRLAPESPAEAAGLLPQDVIVAVDGVGVGDLASMYHALWRGERPDRDVLLEIRRNGETIRLSVHAIDRMSTLSRPRGV
ncbi:MAG: S1C family serine protease [Pseudomonadota bacterium]|nr:S1C family serine protease [Pseudomonadota bacterium]